jgi:hypothetical protein
MVEKAKTPRRLGTSDGAETTSSSEDMAHNRPTSVATPAALFGAKRLPPGWRRFFLHVAEDGIERRFRHEPLHLPTLTVVSDGKLEITATYDTVQCRSVEPRGTGWRYCGTIPGSSLWCRKAGWPL